MKYISLFVLLWLSVQSGIAKRDPTPVILEQSKTTFYVRRNDSVRLPCTVKKQYSGIKKKVLFWWSKRSSPTDFQYLRLNLPRHNVVFNQYLEIENIQSTDHGNYTCFAQNNYGMDTLVINLIVIDRDMNAMLKPTSFRDATLRNTNVFRRIMGEEYLTVSIPFVEKYFVGGKQAKLKCRVQGEPEPNIKWLLNGRPLPASSKYMKGKKQKGLKISEFSSDDTGNYTCIASTSKKQVEMTIIARIHRPYEPTKEVVFLNAKPGQNITLLCEGPADKIKYAMWELPQEVQSSNKQRIASDDLQRDVAKNGKEGQNNLLSNRTIVEKYHLYNVSEELHAGKYLCKAAFVNADQLYVVKEYVITFKTDLSSTTSADRDSKALMIAVPIVAILLTLVIVLIICLQCRKKHAKLLSQKPQAANDDEDTMSMQILTKEPHGSLTIHRKSTDDTNLYASNTYYINSATLERRIKIDKQSPSKLSLEELKLDRSHSVAGARNEYTVSKSDSMLSQSCEVNALKSRPLSAMLCATSFPVTEVKDRTNSKDCKCDELQKVKASRLSRSLRCSSKELLNDRRSSIKSDDRASPIKVDTEKSSTSPWPGQKLQPGDPEYINFINEDLSVCRSSSAVSRRKLSTDSVCSRKTKKSYRTNRCSYRHSLNSENLRATPERTKSRNSDAPSPIGSSLHNSVSDDDGSLPCLHMPEHPEDEDELLMHEMKKWKALKFNSSRDKNDNVEKITESTQLLPSRELYTEGGNLIL